MLSETLQKGLDQYAVGPKVRALRLRKKMGLVELGLHTGLSPALLSKIERGRLVPTLPTLYRIALVFSVGLEHFFEPARRPVLAVVRQEERKRFPERLGDKHPAYVFECLDFPALERTMSAYYVEFENADRPSHVHEHPGSELIYVIDGQVTVTAGDMPHVLKTGDSMFFDASVPHRYQGTGRKPCKAVVVTG